jgi:formiminotetrahydrofolate cyclodeaminase
MELYEMQLDRFVELLGSDAPAPGGGSAAALEGALGAALARMVCSLTVGKEKYAQHQELISASLKQTRAMEVRFLEAMKLDTESFQQLSAAYRLPNGTEAEKDARSAAIQEGLEQCTRPPLLIMGLSVEALALIQALLGQTNMSAVSDIGVSALSLRTALEGAWLNVRINIRSMKNRELAENYRKDGEALLEQGLPLADGIYETVVSSL